MAKKKFEEVMKMPDQIVGEFAKNSQEKVLASLQEFKGKPVFGIRVWYRDLADQWQAGRNGITLSLDHWPEFEKLVKALGEQIRKDG